MSSGHNDHFHHVRDANNFEMPEFVYSYISESYFQLPKLSLLGFEFQITKYMALQTLALVLALLIFRGLARRVAGGQPVRGRWWNFWEALALFVRDQVVRPSIGEPHHHAEPAYAGATYQLAGQPAEMIAAMSQSMGTGEHAHATHTHAEHAGHTHAGHAHAGHAHAGHAHAGSTHLATQHGVDAAAVAGHEVHFADQFLPYIWSIFFYILFCNLFGAIPFLGAATSSTSVTAILAGSVLVATIYAGTRQSGFLGYWKSLVPSMDVPGPIGYVLIPMIWVIEAVGLLIKHSVLAIRLFANMLAGHVVIGVFLSFIASTASMGALWYLVTPASIFGQLAIGALELFVAFLQAYVFSLLASMFIGAAVNPH